MKPVIRLVGHDDRGFLIDSLGRRHPTRMNLLWLLKAVPSMLAQFAEHVDPERIHDWGDQLAVECPCGDRIELAPASIAECSSSCGRFYLHTGRTLRVAHFPEDG